MSNERILVASIFPAEVTFPWLTHYLDLDHFYKDVKVFAFVDAIAIYQQDGPGNITLLYSASAVAEYAPMNPHAMFSMQVLYFPSPDGTITVRPGHGCGCGMMALKAMSPQQVDIG